jgi:hypothetical protein
MCRLRKMSRRVAESFPEQHIVVGMVDSLYVPWE